MREEECHIQRIGEGDQDAFRFFVDTYSNDLYHFALGYVSIREVAEEVVSDVFIDVWNNRSRLGEIKCVKSWLLVLVRNRAISYLRKERGDFVSLDEVGDFCLPCTQSPDHTIISQEEIATINQAIASLSPKCKEVFLLAKIEKMPYKEISEILGISVKTINIHVAKAIETIARVLGK